MEADFSGYATKAGLKCSDGRTIMAHAFRDQDKAKVPLVWQHGHTDPENVLGHAILENRDDGVYAYGFFNKSGKANHAHNLLEHGDINMMSIWANDLVQRNGNVLHGKIREVSLVLSGANPGAIIENVTVRHSDGDKEQLEDEAIIYTGLELEHGVVDKTDDESVEKTDGDKNDNVEHAEDNDDDGDDDDGDDETIEDVYNSMSDKQKQVLHFMLGEAVEAAQSEVQQDNLGDNAGNTNDQEGKEMAHNVFENDAADKGSKKHVLSHADAQGIMADALRVGSLKEAVKSYALSHGIDDIDVLFPEARAISGTPDFISRRMEWVSEVLGATRKSPFARVKTFSADITEDEARARGYIKGSLKKEEYFSVARRVTTPTTVYKKQKLDRDDIIDIVDFDVVTWLRAEMRIMLDEEIARAVLVGDGRDVSSEDKVNEGNIRPIANDHMLYATTLTVDMVDANSSATEIIDTIITHRADYKGTGLPTFYTTETVIAQFMLLKDTVGRRLYKNLDEICNELRVSKIVPVEVMEEYTDLVGIIVNLQDYTIGADRGGAVAMFDDFDIDYNQQKYLIETRISGALTKPKSALVIRKTATDATVVVPATPTQAEDGDDFTIVNTTGVVYTRTDTEAVVNAAGSPYTIPVGTAVEIVATPAAGYMFTSNAKTSWTFRNRS